MTTLYGDIWAQIPQTAGRVFWVAPGAGSYRVNGNLFDASDGNDGLRPERALATVNRAWALVSANSGDVIVLLPGTHTPSASIAASVAGVTMMGLPGGRGNWLRPKATIAAVTGNENCNVSAADIEIAHLNWIPVTADTAIDLTADADRLYVHDCHFDFATPAVSTGTIGIQALGAASNVLIERCYWDSDGAQGNAIDATALLDSIIQECDFTLSAGTWASVILCGAATARLLIRRCTFIDFEGTAITVAVNGTGATIANGVAVADCRFGVGVTVPIDGFDAAEAMIVENYDMGVGAADGGALITAIT